MTSSRRIISFPWHTDSALETLAGAVALATSVLLCVGMGLLALEAWPVMNAVGIGKFFTDATWHPSEGTFGITPMLVATAATTIGAILLAAPLAIGAAVCATYMMPKLPALAFHGLIGLLAGIPSVVIGLWGINHLVPLIARHEPPGTSILAGTLILAMMILPTVYLGCAASLRSIPRQLKSSSHALGMSKMSFIRHIALPLSRPGTLYATLLAVGRALGEAMALIMVSGNIPRIPQSIFDPVRTLAANMALEMAYATDLHRAALYVSSIVLLLIVLALASTSLMLARGAMKHA